MNEIDKIHLNEIILLITILQEIVISSERMPAGFYILFLLTIMGPGC